MHTHACTHTHTHTHMHTRMHACTHAHTCTHIHTHTHTHTHTHLVASSSISFCSHFLSVFIGHNERLTLVKASWATAKHLKRYGGIGGGVVRIETAPPNLNSTIIHSLCVVWERERRTERGEKGEGGREGEREREHSISTLLLANSPTNTLLPNKDPDTQECERKNPGMWHLL